MLLAGPRHCLVTVDLMGSRRPRPGTWPPRRCLTSRSSSWSLTPIKTEFWLSHKSKMPSGFLENLSEVSTISVWLEIDTLAFYSDEELLSLVKKFSEDTKNLSVEFNEFLKMLAYHKNVKSVRSCEELVAAFGSVLSSCTITNNVSEHEQWPEFSNVCIDIDIIHNIRRRHTLE